MKVRMGHKTVIHLEQFGHFWGSWSWMFPAHGTKWKSLMIFGFKVNRKLVDFCMFCCVCVCVFVHMCIYVFLRDYISWLALAPHSSTLTWRIPWMEEPGGLQSMGSRRVRHDWATSLSLFSFLHWRRKWQPTPVFLPGESQGRGSLVGCHLWGHTESDLTEVT